VATNLLFLLLQACTQCKQTDDKVRYLLFGIFSLWRQSYSVRYFWNYGCFIYYYYYYYYYYYTLSPLCRVFTIIYLRKLVYRVYSVAAILYLNMCYV